MSFMKKQIAIEDIEDFLKDRPSLSVWDISKEATGSIYTLDRAIKRGNISANLSDKVLPILVKYGYAGKKA